MFTKSKPKQIILLDKELTPQIKEDHLIEVILSPSLYWVKKFKVPVDSLKEALELLPSLFEEFLPDGEYHYFGYFEGEDFIGFAYNKGSIVSLLKEKGIDLSKVKGIRFAQSEFTQKFLPYKLDTKRVLVLQDGIVIVMPSSFVKEQKNLKLEQLVLSPHVEKFNHFVDVKIDQKTFLLFFVLIFALIVFDMMAWWNTAKESKTLERKSEQLFLKANLSPTMMQNRVLMKKYEKLYTQQHHLRELLYKVLHVDFPKGVIVSELIYEDETLTMLFSHVKNKKDVLEKLKGFHIKYSTLKADQLKVEISR